VGSLFHCAWMAAHVPSCPANDGFWKDTVLIGEAASVNRPLK